MHRLPIELGGRVNICWHNARLESYSLKFRACGLNASGDCSLCVSWAGVGNARSLEDAQGGVFLDCPRGVDMM